MHSNRVRNALKVTDLDREGDALVTDAVGLSIGIRTADCVPILLLAARQRAVAAVHAGWKGTVAGIAVAAAQRLQDDFQAQAGDLWAAIGPCIRACCYEVGAEVAECFPEARVLGPRGKDHVDLARANRQQLEGAGVPAGQIFDCELCTSCRPDEFFSFRREPADPGRMLSHICRIA